MSDLPSAAVQGRMQQLGRELYSKAARYSPSPAERFQDWLMSLLMRDAGLRGRALRFIDVLAALPRDPLGRSVARLYREYLGVTSPTLPRGVRFALKASASPLVPAPVLAWGVRRGTRLMASRFIVTPGPRSIDQALRRLQRSDRLASFDLLGEEVLSDAEADRYRRSYVALLETLGGQAAAGRQTPGRSPCLEVSLKLSSLTAEFNPADPDGTLRRMRPALEEIFALASRLGIGVTVDAEQYVYRDLVWHIFREALGPGTAFAHWSGAGLVVQAYLKDSDRHAEEVTAFARLRAAPVRVRLVKGAYWDYEVIAALQAGWPVPVHEGKGNTDLAFQGLIRLFLESRDAVRLAVGSHNIRAHAYAEAAREELGLPEGAVEHQTLFRTLESLGRALAQMGWPTRDYVPVGELIPGMAYLVRRVLENTSQVGFLARSRRHESIEALLRPPQAERAELPYGRPPHPTGFVNTPPQRLFDAGERRRFKEALEKTRRRWGAEYPLELGSEEVRTEQRVPSVAPSYPDPARPAGWVYMAGPAEAERAIALANGAAAPWAAVPAGQRVAIGLRAAELLRNRKEEVAAWVVHEGGRIWPEALADVEEAIDHITWAALQLRRLGALVDSAYRPRGVVACIAPWNFPTALPAGMTSAALLAGNAVVLKSSEKTPIVAHMLVRAFRDAGVPREALIHLPAPGRPVGAMLVESPAIDMVAFTGSKAAGVWIYGAAARVAPRRGGIKRVVAEMGGKNAIIVLPDADMDEAVQGILRSAFSHAGQKCSACSRVLVHRQVQERLAERLVAAARSLPIGPADDPGTAINPIIDGGACAKIAEYGAVARKEGRVLLEVLGGAPASCAGPLIVQLEAAEAGRARTAQEEIFGPVLALIPFGSTAEAIELANNTVYGLTLSVYSRSPGAIKRLVRECRAGNVYVNRECVGARVGIEPFGGFQLSGTGPKAGGEEYLLAFLTRRDAWRVSRAAGDARTAADGAPAVVPAVRPWTDAPVTERLRRLGAASRGLEHVREQLEAAIGRWKGLAGAARAAEADETLATVSKVLGAARELTEPQSTVAVPGQTTFVTWSTPRGAGVVAVDDGSSPAMLCALLFAPLMAGNGVLVAASPGAAPVAEVVVGALRRAGVPKRSIELAPPGVTADRLAAGLVHFAAVDLSLAETRAVYGALGGVDEAAGQRWLKALISMNDGPRPGEAGFLRLFAHPKTVAIRTLRHGADLKLV